jgi:hypothetical protein
VLDFLKQLPEGLSATMISRSANRSDSAVPHGFDQERSILMAAHQGTHRIHVAKRIADHDRDDNRIVPD